MVTTGRVAGDYEPQGAVLIQSSKGTSAAIVKGNVCTITSGKFNKAAATANLVGPNRVSAMVLIVLRMVLLLSFEIDR